MDKKGFTLIEVLAVIIILGVIMTIAVPNVLSMLDRNKKDTFIEHAKTMINQAEYTLRKDTSINYPEAGKAILITLNYLNTDDISESPYNTTYSPSKSFVLIANVTENGITEYKYYAHLVACSDEYCTNNDENSINKIRGINLSEQDALSGGNRFSLVEKGNKVDYQLLTLEMNGTISESSKSEIASKIGFTVDSIFE